MRSFFRNSTVPRYIKTSEDASKYECKTLTLSPDESAWTLEDDAETASKCASTVEGTPFSQTSNQLYYKTRPTMTIPKTHVEKIHKSTKSRASGSSSLRRRANSLDCLPSPTSSPLPSPKHSMFFPSEVGKPAFNRSTSLSQRSPFRKRIAFVEPESGMAGIKDQRPRSLKRYKNTIDAIFDCIERDDCDEIKKLLQHPDVKINDLNSDDFTPLDVTLMKNQAETAQLLLLHGATENQKFLNPDTRSSHLEYLIKQADGRVNDLTASIVNCTSDVKDSERQLREWEWRLCMLRIMQNGFINTDVPSEKPVVSAAPLSDQSIIVILTPERHSKSELVTRYKVEWSTDEDFNEINGTHIVFDMRNLQYTIHGLEKSKKWYIRVQAGNMRGFGPAVRPEPSYVVPSSWHELNNSKPNYIGCKEALADLLQQLLDYKFDAADKNHTVHMSKNGSSSGSNRESPRLGRKVSVLRTMSKYTNMVFHSAPKLLKRMKCRGIYLASLLYNADDDRVMVTMDDNLPVAEVDDNYSKSFSQEFFWLAKVTCSWTDVHQMFSDSSKGHSSHSINTRRKLLQAGMVLQNATGVQDLGFLYYKAFKDSHGSILLLTINCIKKNVCGTRTSTMKWVPISRLQKKSAGIQDSIAPERLIPALQDQVMYHKRSKTAVTRGLYLGYLKLRTAMDSLSIVVPESHPNLLPHVKIRDIPNVTKEDWLWIHSLGSKEEPDLQMSPSLAAFESKLKSAARKLFSNLGIDDEYSYSHRIYTKEVLELNEDVLFILILPPVDDICTTPGQTDLFHSLPGYTSMPVQTFEMINTNTYQPDIMRPYARMSSMIEMESLINLQAAREALSPVESKIAKDRQTRVLEIQQNVDVCWKNARWILETAQTARDRQLNCGVHVGYLYNSDFIFKASTFSSPSSRRSRVESSLNKNGVFLKNGCMVKVYGTEEIGVHNNHFVEILINKETTAKELIRLAAQDLFEYVQTPSNDLFKMTKDNLNFLGLVVLSGSKERCLRDDLKLLSLQNPWEKGQLFLRLKKEAYKAASLSKSTSV